MNVNADDEGDGVFYDLDAGSKRGGSRSLLALRGSARSSRAQPPANTKSAAGAAGILQQPKELFGPSALLTLDASDGDGDAAESEDENPFASLLQAAPLRPCVAEVASDDEPQAAGPSSFQHEARASGAASSLPWSSSLHHVGSPESPIAPKKRSLADVLMRATLLSQQKPHDERSEPQHHVDNPQVLAETEDTIADTERQMREEKFEVQFFSPSKLTNPGARRKQKPDAAAAKIRGELGDAIARAIRKTTRDLTMLHSHGQTLLEENRDTPGFENSGLERVQDRAYTVVYLRRQREQPEGGESASEQTVYDGHIHAFSRNASTSPCPENTRVRIVFSSQATAHLTLRPNALVKVYAPYHFVPLERAVGSSKLRARTKWLLVGTTLSEMVA